MMALQQAAQILNAELHGEDVEFSSVSTDTRSMQKGDLYVALHGENFDGHDYLEQAKQSGAIAAVVHKDVQTTLPHLKVQDTRKALGKLASAWRQLFSGKVVAITGSNGKTTVKEMTAALLEEQGEVLATAGNFNNDIGLPLTLLRLAKEDYAVIEMGANHAGEISYLTGITQPDIAIINNAGASHLDGFGSLEGVATAKGEIYQGLGKNGIAIINKDDQFSDYWISLCADHKILKFSMKDKTASVYGEWQQNKTGGELKITISEDGNIKETFNVNLRLFGLHNAMNALAATTVGIALGVSGKKISSALNGFKAVKGRLNVQQINDNLTVIDDTYNANPSSLEAGINVLKEMNGQHWLVLGDMGELGGDEEKFHAEAGKKAHSSGVNKLLAVGKTSQYAVNAFGMGAQFFENKDELVSYIKQHKSEELTILIKGSRFMHMEEIVESLIKEGN